MADAPGAVSTSEVACPRCGTPMVIRINRVERSEFWGCPRFPTCRGTRPLEAIRATRSTPTIAAVPGAIGIADPPSVARPRPAAGGSARAVYERRSALHRERVKANRPLILLRGLAIVIVGLALAAQGDAWSITGPMIAFVGVLSTIARLVILPSSVRAWGIGARGEEALGRRLDALEANGFVVFHDLSIPKRRENIDHLLIGPPGIVVVETKNYAGSVHRRGRDLVVGGRRKTEFLDQVERQIAAVEDLLGVRGVRGFICVLRGDLPFIRRVILRDIEVVSPRRLIDRLTTSDPVLDPGTVRRLADRVSERFA